MAGTEIDELIAWCLPASTAGALGLGDHADHTYVTSATGLAWGCYGRSTGGRRLQSGSGSSRMADCLAQPDGKAGIHYLRTGVCHQISNRILWPSGVVVEGAAGYEMSVLYYGTYGRKLVAGSWPERDLCGDGSAGGPSIARLSPEPIEVQVEEDEVESNAIDDFRELLRRKLEHDISEQEVSQLLALQRIALAKKSQILHDLDADRITPADFINLFKVTVRENATMFERVLGTRRYHVFFGNAPEAAASFVEDRMFFNSEGRIRSSDGSKEL